MYQPLIKFHPYPAIFTQVLSIFEVNFEYILHSLQNTQASLALFRSFVSIFGVNFEYILHSLQNTQASLALFRSFVTIFAF